MSKKAPSPKSYDTVPLLEAQGWLWRNVLYRWTVGFQELVAPGL